MERCTNMGSPVLAQVTVQHWRSAESKRFTL